MNKTRFSSILIAVALLAGTILAADTAQAHNVSSSGSGWADRNCYNGPGSYPGSKITPNAAYNSVYWARSEGYHWGGGCANDNNVDDQRRTADVQNEVGHGEGPDCSGFVLRAWQIQSSGSTNFQTYATNYYYHGPFVAADYRSSRTAWRVISKTSMTFFDAFASTSHIGLIYSYNSDGTQVIFESKAEMEGTGLFTRNYQDSSTYTSAERNNWA